MTNTVDKLIKVAEAEVGYLEKRTNSQLDDKTANAGRNNYTKYGRDMHKLYPSVMDFPAAWCDCFVDWCFVQAYGESKAKVLLGGSFNDYTPSSAQMYKNMGAWHTSNPQVGDQIFFKNETRICHTGIVYKVDATKVYTIEGNTNGASGVIANGGGVCKKSYSLKYYKIAGYGRPEYDKETEKTDGVKPAQSFDKGYAKSYKTTSGLNMRSGAGTSNSVVKVLPKGAKVTCYGYYTKVGPTVWLLVQDSTGATGFCSKTYLA